MWVIISINPNASTLQRVRTRVPLPLPLPLPLPVPLPLPLPLRPPLDADTREHAHVQVHGTMSDTLAHARAAETERGWTGASDAVGTDFPQRVYDDYAYIFCRVFLSSILLVRRHPFFTMGWALQILDTNIRRPTRQQIIDNVLGAARDKTHACKKWWLY